MIGLPRGLCLTAEPFEYLGQPSIVHSLLDAFNVRHLTRLIKDKLVCKVFVTCLDVEWSDRTSQDTS